MCIHCKMWMTQKERLMLYPTLIRIVIMVMTWIPTRKRDWRMFSNMSFHSTSSTSKRQRKQFLLNGIVFWNRRTLIQKAHRVWFFTQVPTNRFWTMWKSLVRNMTTCSSSSSKVWKNWTENTSRFWNKSMKVDHIWTIRISASTSNRKILITFSKI